MGLGALLSPRLSPRLSLILMSLSLLGVGCGRTEVTCEAHIDCLEGQACVRAACVSGDPCVEGLCPSGRVCVAEVCVSRELLPNECDAARPCPEGALCVEGVCAPACPGGQCLPCEGGAESCEPPRPLCVSDATCPLGSICDLTNADASCLLYTSPSPRDGLLSRMPSSA